MPAERPSRNIVAVTVGRSDYGIGRPVFEAIEADASLRLGLIVSGAHLVDGAVTIDEIEADGRRIVDRVAMLAPGDTAESCARSMGLGTIGFAEAYARHRPDILLVLGDRFEMHAAVVASVPFNIPVAHIHGGELTFGAMDDALRHSITKLSHLHFAATEAYGRRVVQLGEAPWRVTVSGAPALDGFRRRIPASRAALESRFGILLDPEPLLVTYHPVTRSLESALAEIAELLAALERSGYPVVFTAPNADPGSEAIGAMIRDWVARTESARLVESFGADFYSGMLAHAGAMVGNSSSGIIEAPSFALPVVNIGERQRGRTRAANVLDVPPERGAIAAAIAKATSPGFRTMLDGLANPYGDGRAAERIVAVLREAALDPRLTAKEFYDLAPDGAASMSAIIDRTLTSHPRA